MDAETLQLIVEAGPNAVSMAMYYMISNVGITAIITGAITTVLYSTIRSIQKGNALEKLTAEQQRFYALKKLGLIDKDIQLIEDTSEDK